MGADGHIVIARRSDYEAANPDVPASRLSLYSGTVLGVEAVWGYCGDNLMNWANYVTRHGDDFWAKHIFENGEIRGATPEETERIMRAADWFDEHAEHHEVWT